MHASDDRGLGRATRPHAVVRAALVVLLLLAVAQALTFWHYVNDDAYITYRYSRSLATGNGPFFNPGEHVEGYTNLLLMLFVAGVIASFGAGAAAPAAKALGVACGAAGVLVTFAVARLVARGDADRDRADVAALTAAGLLALSPTWALQSTSGLETTLYGVLLGAGVLLGLLADRDHRWRGSGVAFAAAALARPEGVLLFSVFWLTRALGLVATLRGHGVRAAARDARSRGLVADAVVVTLVFALVTVFRLVTYDGEWLPNTYYAKVGGFYGISVWSYLYEGGIRPFFGGLGLLLAVVGLGLGRARPAVALPLMAVSLFGVAEPVWAAADWMPGWRLVVPSLPLMAAWVAPGWSLALERVPTPGKVAPVLVLAALPLSWLASDPEREDLRKQTLLRAQGYQTGHRALAAWLASGAARRGDTVALMDIGLVGYLNPQLRILDITGLTNRHIAKSPGRFLEKSYDPAYVVDRKPRFVVIVFAADGTPYQVPKGPVRFAPFTPIEIALYGNEAFRRQYLAPPDPGAAPLSWPRDLARSVGGVRVFEHASPDMHYLLVVFERRHEAAGAIARPEQPPPSSAPRRARRPR